MISRAHLLISRRRPLIALCAICFCALFFSTSAASASSAAYVRVNQIGYEEDNSPFRAYLMSTAREPGATTFSVINSQGVTSYSGKIGALLGTWSNSYRLTYYVYALDFTVPGGYIYTISVAGPVPAQSPSFAVNSPDVLYPGLLLNTLFFYETDRDGPDYIPNALRDAPGHVKDENASVYNTPPLDVNDFVDNVPPTPPLVHSALPNINAAGGWWDAGDYMKYVETTSYTVALMQIGIRDFPNQMGANAPPAPPAPPASVSYAGNSGGGAPASSNFTAEALFGLSWLMEMWDDQTKTLYYQVDNSQDWDYYGYGNPTSATGICGGTYSTPYCLITEYDIWTLPQAADNFSLTYDNLFPASASPPALNQPCDQYSTYYICYRAVFPAGPAGSPISPNLAGRLTADFALCYQLNRTANPPLANQCLLNAEDIFALADTAFPDPAPSVNSGSCSLQHVNCLLTIIPFDGYPETVWDDDMELGATELYFALQSAGGDLPSGLPDTDPMDYLQQAAQFAQRYINNVYDTGNSDTLNLYDVSGLAHFELYRAIKMAGNPSGLAVSQSGIQAQLLAQVNDAIAQAATDAWGYGNPWYYFDTTSHGGGLSVMASEAYYLTGSQTYNTYAQRWLANIQGANAWGSSFIVGDGSTFPNCIQHQVANLAGALDGTSGGTPILWGAASEGPATAATSGVVPGMILCPANGADPFAIFNGNDGPYNPSQVTVYQDNMQSYSTTEPAIDLTSTSFLMWSWRMAGQPSF
ncbi:MAG TPA: glycoside hydrolase family 9 protein [Terriglobales bacterium]|nr:glycoside hydrolase family 9 protein [Terriglobales bacterium]